MNRQRTKQKLAKVVVGAKRLSEWWLADQSPVSPEIAEHRASVCAECPLNESPSLFEMLVGEGAKVVKAAFAKKHDMSLKTKIDWRLEICSACGCEIELKIWQPMELIEKQMTSEEMEELDKDCWIKR
jgi:hypothetical protein